MTKTFDLVVIGSGTAARTVASKCRTAGWTVAMVDKLPLGGTCALRGCDPKKVLVGAAAAWLAENRPDLDLAAPQVTAGETVLDF